MRNASVTSFGNTAAALSEMRNASVASFAPTNQERSVVVNTNAVIVQRDTADPKLCYICRALGHFATECPYGKIKDTGKPGPRRLAIRKCGDFEMAFRQNYVANMPKEEDWMKNREVQTRPWDPLPVGPLQLGDDAPIAEGDRVVPLWGGKAILIMADDGHEITDAEANTWVGGCLLEQREKMAKHVEAEQKRKRERSNDSEPEPEPEPEPQPVHVHYLPPRPAAPRVEPQVVYPTPRNQPSISAGSTTDDDVSVYSCRPQVQTPARSTRNGVQPKTSAKAAEEKVAKLRHQANQLAALAKKLKEIEKLQAEAAELEAASTA